MASYGVNELRESFFEFFKGKGHLVLPGFSLIPENDPSLLLINAGMSPLKPYFTGAKEPPCKRVVTCQKCLRTPDIENVGKTSRHGTFFEMLGNFSFGDYFKKEAIAWAWEYITEILEIDKEKLYASVYEDDDEAYDLWKDMIGLPENRIVRRGKEDNFWEHGTGPCGPCSEIHYDRGEEYGCDSPDCGPCCDCDRYIEFWNLVFTQFDKDEKGVYNPLPNPNIDTGLGLERIAMICQGVDNMFEVDTIRGLIDDVCSMTGRKYGENHRNDVSIRVITDHIRGIVHMISDGILPSNEGRGYVLRRLIRRAARHGKLLGAKNVFLHELALDAIKYSKAAYPGLSDKKEHIYSVIKTESDKFEQTLDTGMEVLGSIIRKADSKILSGEDTFKLHDTYGFPIDLTREIAQESGMDIDEEGFKQLMHIQRKKAREAFMNRNFAWAGGAGSEEQLRGLCNKFVGYESMETDSLLVRILNKTDVGAVSGETVSVVFDKTPFYAESGGQAGDSGTVTGNGSRADVIDVKKADGLHIHILEVSEGELEEGKMYRLSVDKKSREATMRNHTATHILHKALCDELGSHIEQKGSYVDEARLRFDFSHFEAIDQKVLEKIQKIVNEVIFSALTVSVTEMDLEQAKKTGAKALFNEKYAENVRVVKIGDYSMELCGGTHVADTGQIGPFKIISESSIASGIRRVEALTGFNTISHYEKKEAQLEELAGAVKSQPEDARAKVSSIMEANRELAGELEILKRRIALEEMDRDGSGTVMIAGLNVISKIFEDAGMDHLRDIADIMKDRYADSVIILADRSDGKVNFIVSVSDKAVEKGINAGKMIKEIASTAGGGGGGKAAYAQAGGKYPEKAEEAVQKGIDAVRGILECR